MKKIFTSFFAIAMALCATEAKADTVIYEGSEAADWGKNIMLNADWSAVEPGTVMEVTATLGGADTYAVFHILNASWEKVKEDISFAYEANTEKSVDVELTADILSAAVSGGGLGIQGYNFTLAKVVLKDGKETPKVEDLAPVSFWSGEKTIDGWGAECLVFDKDNNTEALALMAQTITKACNLYILVANGESANIRIAGQWGDWSQTSFPADGFDHKADADGVVKLQLTDDFVAKAFKEQGGFTVWGNGKFVVKNIATTRDMVLTPTAINSVKDNSAKKNTVVYNLAGQAVSKNCKGMVIVDGKKYVRK